VPDLPIEIITGRERRRRWSVTDKLKIVAESHEPGARIGNIAARHDVCPSLLHGWRRQVREGRLGPAATPGFVPVRLASSYNEAAPPPAALDPAPAPIEVVLPSGGRVLIRHDARASTLRAVIAALRG
jgi:transposase